MLARPAFFGPLVESESGTMGLFPYRNPFAEDPGIDLAILENGQYNEDWKYIHTMPQYLGQVARDLNAEKILTVHHSKYALARHRWDEPLKNAMNLKEKDSLNVLMPIIGEVVRLK